MLVYWFLINKVTGTIFLFPSCHIQFIVPPFYAGTQYIYFYQYNRYKHALSALKLSISNTTVDGSVCIYTCTDDNYINLGEIPPLFLLHKHGYCL